MPPRCRDFAGDRRARQDRWSPKLGCLRRHLAVGAAGLRHLDRSLLSIPCSWQLTLGLSASSTVTLDPRSRVRQRRLPRPRSNPGLGRRQSPHRSRSCHPTREELWQRQRAHVEDRVRDGKSNGLIHLPLGTRRANFGWLVATVTATNLMAMLSATVRAVAPQAELPPDFDAERAPPVPNQPHPATLADCGASPSGPQLPGNCTCAWRGAGGGPTPSPPPMTGYAYSRSPDAPPTRRSLRPSQHPQLPHALASAHGRR